MTHRNAPRMNPMPPFGTTPLAAGGNTLPILQDDLVHWNGQPIALVLAETQEQANHARSLIRATYETAPAVTSFDEAKAHARQPQPFLGRELATKIGDAEGALAAPP